MSDIDTVPVDSLKALDPKRPIREADNSAAPALVHFWTTADIAGFWRATKAVKLDLGPIA